MKILSTQLSFFSIIILLIVLIAVKSKEKEKQKVLKVIFGVPAFVAVFSSVAFYYISNIDIVAQNILFLNGATVFILVLITAILLLQDLAVEVHKVFIFLTGLIMALPLILMLINATIVVLALLQQDSSILLNSIEYFGTLLVMKAIPALITGIVVTLIVRFILKLN